ncbi:MAG: hypothetical protein M5R41_09925 [Bacteroidia bacterium]|nr:hypothetical protein [Bacteroidia bacterium]
MMKISLTRSRGLRFLLLGVLLLGLGLLSPSVHAQLNGVYTIGPSGTYSNFNDAVTALVANGVSGPVTFNVQQGTYTQQVSIPAITGASSTNTITFDGGAGNAATRILQYNTASQGDYVLKLNGADYFRFKNLTIRATGSTYGFGVLFTSQANYNHLIDCSIEVSTTSTNYYCIAVHAGNGTSYSAYGNWANHTLVEGCRIKGGGYYGVRFNGSSSSSTTLSVNNRFINNEVTDFNNYGMYFYYQPALQVNYNYIRPRVSTSSSYGIYSYYANEGAQMIGNDIQVYYNPLRSMYHNYARSSSNVRGLVANNMLVATSSSTNYGLYVSYPRYTDVVYNTLYMHGSSTGYGIYNYGATTNYDNKYLNNIIAKKGSGTFYAIYNQYSSDMTAFDHNLFWCDANVTPSFRWNATIYSGLTALQNAVPSRHQNSVYGDPYFTSDTDLHSSSDAAYQAGLYFAGVTDDFDGDTRLANPCIGADEFPEPPPMYEIGIAKVRLNYADGKWTRGEDPAAHSVDLVLENNGRETNPSGISITYKVGSMPTSEFDGVQQTFSPSWSNGKAVVRFNQKVSGLVPTAGLTVHARVFWALDADPANNSGSDTRTVDNGKIHGRENFNAMLAPDFSDDPGYLDYDWKVTDPNGGTTWVVANGVGVGATNGIEYAGDTQTADDWLFTPPVELLAAASYRIAFVVKSVTGAPQMLEVAYGSSPDPGSMTTFATFSNFTNTDFLSAKQLAGGMDPYFNTPATTGAYFIGFRVISNAGAGALVIDDIVLDDNPSPPPKIAFGNPGDPLETFMDSPESKIAIQANYKAPGLITKTYQVVSSTDIYGVNGDFLWDVESNTSWIKLTKATPEATAQGYNFSPPRPRQFQDFTLTVNPNGLAPGLHVGQITFYGILFNDDFPPPSSGLIATNEPLTIDVELRVVNAGTKSGSQFEEHTVSGLTSGNTYDFKDPDTGNPIATVEVTSGDVTGMTIRAYPYQLPQNLARMLYVKRYWQITTTGSGWWTANITFPYSDQEAVMVADRNQLHGVRQAVALGQWEDPIVGTSSTSDPGMNIVKVFDLNPTNSTGNIVLAQSYMMGKPGDAAPTAFALEQNFPNPFNPSTSIRFTVADERQVRLTVYNNLGVEVAELLNDVLPSGQYTVDFNALTLPTGTYTCRMVAGDFVGSVQMILSK